MIRQKAGRRKAPGKRLSVTHGGIVIRQKNMASYLGGEIKNVYK